MATYKVVVRESAVKELERLEAPAERRLIVARIASLARVPVPSDVESLPGHDDRFRVRKKHYRIVYQVDETKHEITVYKIGMRRKFYRR